MSDLFAPEGGWRVRILDLSGASEDNIVEEVAGFPTLTQANAFARAYVCDSVERCRVHGASAKDVLGNWFAFGEDAEVLDAGEQAWRSSSELADLAGRSATSEECDWRVLDPRNDPGSDIDAHGAGDSDP